MPAKKGGRGGRRDRSGRPLVWTHGLKVWLLIEFYTLRASGKTSDEAWQIVAYRLGKDRPEITLTSRRLTEARRDVKVTDLPSALLFGQTTIADWAKFMLAQAKANRSFELWQRKKHRGIQVRFEKGG